MNNETLSDQDLDIVVGGSIMSKAMQALEINRMEQAALKTHVGGSHGYTITFTSSKSFQ